MDNSSFLPDSKFENINQFLKSKIDDYKKSHPFLSNNDIAKKMNLSPGTFNRIYNLSAKQTSIENVIVILKEVGQLNDFLQALNLINPRMINVLHEFYDLKVSPGHYISDKFTSQINFGEFCLILLWLVHYPKFRKRTFLEYFGYDSEAKLEYLVKIDYVLYSREEDLYQLNQQEVYSVNPALSLEANWSIKQCDELIHQLINTVYKNENMKNNINWKNVSSFSVNKKTAIPLVRQMIRQFRKDLGEVLLSKEHAGQDIIWITTIMDEFYKQGDLYE